MNNSRLQLLSEIRNWDLSQIEAALEEASQRGSTSDEALFVRARAYHFFRKGMVAESQADTKRAIELAANANDAEILGMALGLQANIFTLQGNPESEPYYRHAIDLLVESGNLTFEITTRSHYGNLLCMQGNPADALAQFEKALACCERAGQPSLKMLPLNGIGNVYFNAAEYHRAIDAWKSALTLAREHGENDHLYNSIYNIANAYGMLRENELAEPFAKEALALSSERNERDRPLCHQILAKAHHDRGNFDLAIQEYERSRFLFLQMDERSSAADAKRLIGKCLVETGKIEEGIGVLKGAVEEFLIFTDKNELMATYECLVKAYQMKEDYQHAFEYYQKQSELKDEIFSSDFKGQLLSLERKLAEERTEAATKLIHAQSQQLEKNLTMQTMALATQTETLSKFREELRQITRTAYDPVNALKKIDERLKTLPAPDVDWVAFEKEFMAVHPEFRKKLQDRFPELTNQELRLCQLLRTGLKSNEAARLMNITERGVEQHRLRVRRKLGIKGKESLTEYLGALP